MIKIEGREYRVTRDGGQYILTGARGARYRLLRNSMNTHMLYLINDRDWTMSAPKSWLTDKHGKLEVAS